MPLKDERLPGSCKAGPLFSILALVPKDPDFGPSPLGSFAKCVRAALPRLNYLVEYQAQVVRFALPLGSVSSLVDLVPDDPDVPPMAAVPFRPGVPGMVIADLPKGTTIMVGWSGGDPSRPYCTLPGGGEHVGAMTFNADQLTLGGDAGALPAARQSDPVTLTLTPADILAVAAAVLATGIFVPSGSPPTTPPSPIPLSQQQIVSGSSVVKIK